VDTLQLMRPVVALQSCLALLVASFFAPFQHVHHGDGSGHDQSSFIHIHFYAVAPEEREDHDDGAPEIEHRHDGHTASPLDTFTVVPTAAVTLSQPLPVIIVIPAPSASSANVEVVEERGHSPPATAPSIPRAPPA
jgi:hypothetical protein